MNFNLGNVADWVPLGVGEVVNFGVVDEYRKVLFDILTDKPVRVMAVTASGFIMVGCGVGQFSVAFTATADTGISVECEDDEVLIWMRGYARPQIIPASLEPSYVRIEPRSAVPNADVLKMMQMVQANSLRREAQMRAEFDRKMAALVAVPPPAPPKGLPVPEPVEVIERDADAS